MGRPVSKNWQSSSVLMEELLNEWFVGCVPVLSLLENLLLTLWLLGWCTN